MAFNRYRSLAATVSHDVLHVPANQIPLGFMLSLTAETLLPAAMIGSMAAIAMAVGVRVLLSDANKYDAARKLTGSPKRAVLGLVSPELPHEMDSDVERGFALGYRDGRPFVVLNGKLPADNLT